MRARCVKNRLGPSSFGLGGIEFAAWIWIGCALFNIVLSQENFYTHGRYGKREEHQQSSLFWSGSRYGRSGATGERNAKSISKAVEVAPRVDRFFFGSRYGKRTLPAISFRTSTPLTRLGAALNYLNQARRAERARHNDGEFPNHDDRTRRMEHLRRELTLPNSIFSQSAVLTRKSSWDNGGGNGEGGVSLNFPFFKKEPGIPLGRHL